jgi:DNA-binding transcriptional LysR family regulator
VPGVIFNGVKREGKSFRGFTIQQIEIFLTVAKHLNYTKAAKELYISQPAISSWIMKMEDSLGVKLFRRRSRGVDLTPEGLELYTKLEHVYQRFRVSVNMIMRDMIKMPKFDIGCLNSIDIVKLTCDMIDRFHCHNKNVDVYYEMFNYQELRQKLLCSELDAIVTLYFDVKNQANIHSKVIGSLSNYFFFPKAWGKDGGDIASLLDGKIMILEINNGERHAVDICRSFGFEPAYITHVNSYLEITKAIAEGDCFTIGGRDLAKDSHFMPALSSLPREGFKEEIAVAWYEKNENPWLERFLELL